MNWKLSATWYAATAVAATAILLTAFSYELSGITADETVLAWMGKQVATGRVPYRDFFLFLPPVTAYGIGFFYRVVEPSVGALRLLTVAWLVGSTLVLFALLFRSNGERWLSCALALLLPGLFVPYWAVASHHWFALGFGVTALLFASGERPRVWHWIAAGVCTGMAGMTVQTSGVLYGLIVLALALAARRADGARWWWPALLVTIGVLVVPATLMLVLWRADALPAAIWNVVIWPLRYYKQPGGANAVGPSTIEWPSPPRDSLTGMTEWVAAGFASSIPLMLLVLLAWSFLRRRASGGNDDAGRTRFVVSAAGGAAIFLVYVLGRPDWLHLVVLLPAGIVMFVREIAWRGEDTRPRVIRGWAVAAFCGVLIFWGVRWPRTRPSVDGVLRMDAALQHGIDNLVDLLPGTREGNRPILYLNKAGSALYFYWAPVPPPVDWIERPSARYNSPREFELIARFADQYEVPWIVMLPGDAQDFMRNGSAIGALLEERYRPAMETEWGTVYERVRVNP
jgi:hypothetical protein